MDSHRRRHGRRQQHVRSSVSGIEIAVHLKVQNSALSKTRSHTTTCVLPSTNSLSCKLALNWYSITIRCWSPWVAQPDPAGFPIASAHSTPSLRGRGFHTRIRRRRHLVHHGRVLVLVAVLSISSVLLSVRVSDFVLFCSLGFLACGLVSLDLLRLAHIVSVIALLLVLLGYSLAFTTF